MNDDFSYGGLSAVGTTPPASGMIFDSASTDGSNPDKQSRNAHGGFTNGDNLEQKYWDLFIKKEFPSYKTYWDKYVEPLRSDSSIHISDDADADDTYNAQLHYSVLFHLAAAYNIIQQPEIEREDFSQAIISLCSSLDIADELISRSLRKYKSFDRDDSRKAQFDGRDDTAPVQLLRDYRNALAHAVLVPMKIKYGTKQHKSVPKLDKINDYLDWRSVTNRSWSDTSPDFSMIKDLLSESWEITLTYLEDRWQNKLL